MKKITSIIISFFLFFSAHADTINSASKNTSVAVYGTQRTSTAIQPWVIPVAVAGAACNSTTDIVAVTSDHSSQLICQSGTWQYIIKSASLAGFVYSPPSTLGYFRSNLGPHKACYLTAVKADPDADNHCYLYRSGSTLLAVQSTDANADWILEIFRPYTSLHDAWCYASCID